MDVLIVGAGAMGGWLGDLLADRPTFTDLDSSRAERTAAAVGGETIAPDASGTFDLVCIAVPMTATRQAITAHGDRATKAIIDITGAMAPALAAMREVTPDRQRASFHPLFAPDNAPGNIATVVDNAGPVVARVIEQFEAAGNAIIETTAGEHDKAMESIQAAAHAAVLAYGLAVDDVPAGFETPVSQSLDALVERVTGGNPGIYADIQTTFPGAERVADAAQRIAAADHEEFQELYARARPARTDTDG